MSTRQYENKDDDDDDYDNIDMAKVVQPSIEVPRPRDGCNLTVAGHWSSRGLVYVQVALLAVSVPLQ